MSGVASGNCWVAVGSVLGFLGVAFGAFGAHGLHLEGYSLDVYRTGAQYHLVHALALAGLGLWGAQNPGASTTVAGLCFAIGTVIFAGSLYALAITGMKWLGAITPIGGALFLIGWASLAWNAWAAARANGSAP